MTHLLGCPAHAENHGRLGDVADRKIGAAGGAHAELAAADGNGRRAALPLRLVGRLLENSGYLLPLRRLCGREVGQFCTARCSYTLHARPCVVKSRAYQHDGSLQHRNQPRNMQEAWAR